MNLAFPFGQKTATAGRHCHSHQGGGDIAVLVMRRTSRRTRSDEFGLGDVAVEDGNYRHDFHAARLLAKIVRTKFIETVPVSVTGLSLRFISYTSVPAFVVEKQTIARLVIDESYPDATSNSKQRWLSSSGRNL
jgi:hypothetical protein